MTEPPIKVLIVDDESQIRNFIKVALRANGYESLEVDKGQAAIEQAALKKPDIVVLDLGLPDMDGKEVIKAIRQWSQLPIIVLSVRAQEVEKVAALDLGADDYVTKPFGVAELMARIRTALRHKLRSVGTSPVFRVGDLTVDLVKRQVHLKAEEVHLSKKEYQILTLLVQHAGLVVTHQQILRQVWGDAYAHDTAYLRVFIRQLRSKIEPDPARPHYIVTESGVGYRLREEE